MSAQRPQPDLERLAEAVAGEQGLTAGQASFARRDVVAAVANALPVGAPVDEIERFADALLGGDRRLVALGPARGRLTVLRPSVHCDDGEARYTTRSLLATETTTIQGALARRREGVASVPPSGLAFLLRRHRELGPTSEAWRRR
ncbi:MAG: hypothetical protein M3O70_04415 [Actinomycetota bacterium]|nr:hypothetical protein [Actinomycetota bacterium]